MQSTVQTFFEFLSLTLFHPSEKCFHIYQEIDVKLQFITKIFNTANSGSFNYLRNKITEGARLNFKILHIHAICAGCVAQYEMH